MSDVNRTPGSDRATPRSEGRGVAKSLGLFVEQEAKRVSLEDQVQGDPALIAAGWERRFVADARRAEEALTLYEELGYEVTTVPAEAEELGDDCEDCQLLLLLQFQTIYTRRARGGVKA